MAAGQDGDERALDHLLLAEDDGRGRFLDALDALAGRFDAADDGLVGLGECAHDLNYTLGCGECETVLANMVTI